MPKFYKSKKFFIRLVVFTTLAGSLSGALLPTPAVAQDAINPQEFSTLSIPMSPTNTRWAYQLINSASANSAGFTGSGVRVALLDNGIDHRVTSISSKVIARFDATNSVSGQNDHGTATSSIVAADPMPEAGIGGVAPGASILDVRVCLNSGCQTKSIIAGLKWAIDNGANVISMSLGGGQTIEPAVAHLIRTAISQGIVVVAAAGNNACTATYESGGQTRARNCTQNSLPMSYPGSNSIPGLITVGAIGKDLTRNSYSNYGAYVDVVAPGTDVATFYPWGPNAYFAGTSAAAPIVAGIAALIKQAAPNVTSEQVQAILQSTTTDPVTATPNVWESCTYTNNLWDCQNLSPARWPTRYYTGAGVVNAQSAVAMANLLNSGAFKTGLLTSSQDSAINLDWSNSGLGSGPYQVLIDGKQFSETSNTSFQATGLINSSQYAIQIADAAGNKTVPTIGTAGSTSTYQAPVISTPQVYANAVYLSVASEPNLSKGVLLLANGDQATCARSGSSLRFDCDYIIPTNPIVGSFKLVDDQGNFSAESNQLTFNNSGLPATSSVNLNVVSETEVSAGWTAIDGASHYCYYDAGIGAWLATTNTSVQITGVKPGLPQTFTVFASNSTCGPTGLYSPTFWYLPFGPALTAPNGLTLSNLSSNGVEINFNAPIGADRYAVYRSDGKNWIAGPAVINVSDVFSQSDQGKTFTYWITALDDVQYGSQYGAISSPISLTVPTASVQSINNQPAGSQQPAPANGGGASSANSGSSSFMPPSSITFNSKLRSNSVTLSSNKGQTKIGANFRVTGASKSGAKVDITVSGPCEIINKSGSRATIRGTAIGNCQIYGLAMATSKFNAAERFLTVPVGLTLDSIKLSSPSKVIIGRDFKISAKTKSNKSVSWSADGPCQLISQAPNFAILRAVGPTGSCIVTANTSIDGSWAQVGASARIAIK